MRSTKTLCHHAKLTSSAYALFSSCADVLIVTLNPALPVPLPAAAYGGDRSIPCPYYDPYASHSPFPPLMFCDPSLAWSPLPPQKNGAFLPKRTTKTLRLSSHQHTTPERFLLANTSHGNTVITPSSSPSSVCAFFYSCAEMCLSLPEPYPSRSPFSPPLVVVVCRHLALFLAPTALPFPFPSSFPP